MKLTKAMENRARATICNGYPCDDSNCNMVAELLAEVYYLREQLDRYKAVYPGVPVLPGEYVSWGHTGPCQPGCDCASSPNPRNLNGS